jgi:NAD-dependent SIR2 family protein deacetylase
LSLVTNAKSNGSLIVEINPAETQATGFTDASIRGTADEVFGEVGRALMDDVDWDKLNLEKWDPPREWAGVDRAM